MSKKTSITVLIVVGAVLCAALIVGIVFGNSVYAAISNQFYAQSANATTQAHFEADAQGIRNINLNFSSEDIYVVQTNESKIRIEEACSAPIDQQLLMQCNASGDTVSAEGGLKNRWFFNWTFGNIRVTLYVPASYGNNLSVRSSSGEIRLKDIKADTLALNSSSGDISASNLQASKLQAESTSGEINLLNSRAGGMEAGASSGEITVSGGSFDTVNVHTSSGDIRMEAQHMGSIEADASSGEVNIAADEMPGQIKVNTSSGDVTLRLPDSDGFALNRESSSGHTRNDFAMVNGGVYKNGQNSIDVQTTSGDLNIIKR